MSWRKRPVFVASYLTTMENKTHAYGRCAMTLEHKQEDLAQVEAELRELGRNLKQAGELVEKLRGDELDRPTVEIDIRRLWELVSRRALLVQGCAEDRATLETLLRS